VLLILYRRSFGFNSYSDCPTNGVNMASNLTSAKGIALATLGSHGDVYDEDCLAVNVWTKPQTGEKAKAVLLWIYVRT
jgi:cholinesterase